MGTLRMLLRRVFLENAGTKLVALAVALLLFYFVREGRQEVKSLSVDVELLLPKGVVQTNEIARQVEVALVGPKANIDAIGREDLGALKVDLTPFGIGSSTYFFHKEMFPELPKGVTVTSFAPSYVAVRLEKEVSRILPVTPILKGQPAHGYRVDRYTLSDVEATLIGPTSLVDRTDFLETAAVDITGATQTVEREVPIRLPAPSTRLSLSDPILVTVHVVEDIVERVLEGIPVARPAGFELRIEPASIDVTVKGPLRLVEKMTPGELAAQIELDPRAKKGMQQVPVLRVEGLPAEVARVSKLPRVTVHIDRTGVRTLPPSPQPREPDKGKATP
ncbi:MAG: CdaR family protein [Pseudomonadota bacterium]